jgi:hypothetical protein
MIVKIQTPLNGVGDALVYNQTRAFQCFVDVADVADKMAGRPKAFFHAVDDGETLSLGDEAPWQAW